MGNNGKNKNGRIAKMMDASGTVVASSQASTQQSIGRGRRPCAKNLPNSKAWTNPPPTSPSRNLMNHLALVGQ